jgi:SAM-dependent methyltransferase
MPDGEWWEEFFSGPWLDVQRGMFDQAVTAEQVDRAERLLGLPPRSAILDVPCGEGRVSREFARRGYAVTGVDRTEALLDDARRLADEEGLAIELRRGDMRELPWEEGFDGAVNLWGSFGYFDDDGNRAFAEAVARALRPGGRFFVETFTLETLLPRFSDRAWTRVAGRLVLEERAWDEETGRVETTWTFPDSDPSVEHTSSIRVYTYRELVELLKRAGFVEFEATDTLTGEPFGLGATRLALVATKAD